MTVPAFPDFPGLVPVGRLGRWRAVGTYRWLGRVPFPCGAAVLAVTSAVAALAPNTLVMVLARVGQGVGGAAVIACGLGLIGHAFPSGPERARATGVRGASVGAGIAVGPLTARAREPAGQAQALAGPRAA